MGEIMEEPADAANASTIDGTLRVHMVKRFCNEDGISELEFFETCADAESFHDQWYLRPDICGCNLLTLPYDVESTCVYCRISYCEGEEWLLHQVCE